MTALSMTAVEVGMVEDEDIVGIGLSYRRFNFLGMTIRSSAVCVG